jgi:hypothetical protein
MHRLILFLVVAAMLTACGDGRPAAEATEGPQATDDCGPVEEIPLQGEGHLVGQQEPPIPYNSVPPTSGWHTSGEIPVVVRDDDDPLREPEQVTVLEMGGVVVSYRGLDEAERAELEELIRERFDDRAALTRYDELGEGEVAMTAWGLVQRCDALDPAAVERFVQAYAQR